MPTTRVLRVVAMAGCGLPLLHCGGNNSGPSKLDGSVSDAAALDGGTTENDAGMSGDADAGAPSEDATVTDAPPDAPPPVLVCNRQQCAPSQFCGTVAGAGDAGDAGADAASLQCQNAVFSNICNNSSGTVFFDIYPVDNTSASALGAALGSTCHFPIASPDAGGPTDPDSGEPLTGIGNLCIIAGGASGQPAVAFIDNTSESDVILRGVYDDAGVFDLRFTQEVGPGSPKDLASVAYTGQPVTTDYFLVELTVDPGSGSLCTAVIGMNGEGTAAGTYFVANQLLGNGTYRTSTKSWYLYYWASGTDGGAPSGADTFTPVASGP